MDGGQSAVSAIGALPSTVPPSTVTPSTAHSLLSTGVPCLLHVYWFLHGLHVLLGAIALRAWWRAAGATVAGATDDSEETANHATSSQPLVSPKSDVGGSTDSPSPVPQSAYRPLSTVYRLPLSVYRQLPAYFPSDWAFLIPYLHLLYVWLQTKVPDNMPLHST